MSVSPRPPSRALQLRAPRCQRASNAGSALVLVLLISALLTTVVVSFLSTARIEQLAARNFSQQNAAAGLAELATQQAMAKIQNGFTVNGNSTTVITTQPGAIRQFQFSGGNCTLVAEEELFSGTGNATTNGTANLNNLQNPLNFTANDTADQWTITGNADERINVPMEEVKISENGTERVIGRIAYYIDDEGTKINLNAATGDRPTLNIASSRSLSLSAVASANQSANFTQIINGNATSSNATSDMKNWAHFFRPEQVVGAISGFYSNNIPNFSSAPTVGVDYHTKKTPWGTDRVFINDLPIDSTGVDVIYNALSSSQLRDIYGTTFAEKYSNAGLKQIAANILQARDPNVLNDPNRSFTYNGSLLGATELEVIAAVENEDGDMENCCGNVKAVIPKDYLGNAPYPILNEIGVTVTFGLAKNAPNYYMRLYLRPFISILNPWRTVFPQEEVANWRIEMQVDSIRYDVEHITTNGNIVGPLRYGPTGYKNDDAFGHTFNEGRANFTPRNAGKYTGDPDDPLDDQLDESFAMGAAFVAYSLNGRNSTFGDKTFSNLNYAPSYKQELRAGEELQFPCPPYHNNNGDSTNNGFGVQFLVPIETTQSIDISNIIIKFEYIRLVAKSGDDTTIRDWMLAEDLEVEGCLQVNVDRTNAGDVNPPLEFPLDLKASNFLTLADSGRIWVRRQETKPPPLSIKRLDGRLKTAANMRASSRESMQAWSDSGPATWVDPNASGSASSISATGDDEAYPSTTQGNEIPGDPTKIDSDIRYAYDPAEDHLDSNDWPAIQFTNPANGTGIFTSPADLGKIQTNIQHRKLRFTTQHPNEIHADHGGNGNATKNDGSPLSYIPDWAMLDVISFGSNDTSTPPLAQPPAPINLNGSFHVPSGSPQPSPRTVGLEAALKAIDSTESLGNSFNATYSVFANRSQYMGGGNVSNTVAENIGNLTWSIGNFSAGNATWGSGNSTADPGSRRERADFPVGQMVLPSEVTEIRGVSDVVPLDSYTSNSANIKANEGRLSSLFPGATTQSRFFTIYAYAQALDKLEQPDSEAVTKTLVEVEEQTPVTTPPTYKVKKLYTQPISVP